MNANQRDFFYYISNKLIIRGLFFVCLIISSFFVFVDNTKAGTKTIKSASSDTVYYVDDSNIRHAFPNRVTYESWFGSDFSEVEMVSQAELAKSPLGSNVVMRPGKYLVKVPSSPRVYAVEPGGVLRHITSETTLSSIYGSNWLLKLRDLSEVFFNNYTQGKPIDFSHQIPDGSVVQVPNNETFYWKNNGIIEPFTSFSDVFANGYNRADVIKVDIDPYKRPTSIQGFSSKIFDLSLPANLSTATCKTSDLNSAVVFITRDDDIDSQELAVLQTTIDSLPSSWSQATDGLSQVTLSENLFVFQDKNGELLRQDEKQQTILNLEEISQLFYEAEPDNYDYLIIYNDFLAAPRTTEQASFTLVRNDFSGTNRIKLDRSRFHGSLGRLKGVINMNKIDQYSVENTPGVVSLMNLLHHEILHLWGASISFLNNDQRDFSLLTDDKLHWSRWVNWISPLGGWGWDSLDNGLFTSRRVNLSDSEIIKLPEIDLYLMGLVPARYMSPITYLIPDDIDSVSDTVSGELKVISINEIISAHGSVFCELKD